MNAQTVVKKPAEVNKVARYTVIPARNRVANTGNAAVKSSFAMDLNSILTNGDPPKLMLWGSED